MNTQERPDILFIDDDKLNNLICTKIMNTILPDKNVRTFTNPREGLSFMQSCDPSASKPIVLFLDINMPGLSGWDVLAAFSHFPDAVRQQFIIYVLSSSINKKDREQAENNPFVKAYVEKPLSVEKITRLLGEG